MQIPTVAPTGPSGPIRPPLRRIDRIAYAALILAILIALGAAAMDLQPLIVVLGLTFCLAFAAAHHWLLAWRTLLGGIVLTILFIPIKRYDLPVHLPLQLEPYRLLVGVVGLAMLASLLIDSGLQIRPTGLDAPLAMLFLAMVLSVLFRSSHILSEGLTKYAFRSITFFATYLIVFYLATVAVQRRSDVEWLLRLLIVGASIVGASAIIEAWTHYNFFDHLQQYIPILRFQGIPYAPDRGGARAYASGQHPIAMGAALMMLVPLAIYLAHSTKNRRWWLCCGLLILGALATKSRTAVVMLVVILITIWILKPAETRRMLPRLLPLLLVLHVAMPGTIGTFKSAFFPSSGLVNSETNAEAMWHSNYGKGRIGEWDPAIKEWMLTPLFGQGIGTRIDDLDDPKMNAPILDDQWLGSLLELGVFGVVALLWFFVSAIRRLGRMAKRDTSEDSWLMAGMAASLASYAIGMLTFDAFNFVQVTMLMFLVAALGVAVMRPQPAESESR